MTSATLSKKTYSQSHCNREQIEITLHKLWILSVLCKVLVDFSFYVSLLMPNPLLVTDASLFQYQHDMYANINKLCACFSSQFRRKSLSTWGSLCVGSASVTCECASLVCSSGWPNSAWNGSPWVCRGSWSCGNRWLLCSTAALLNGRPSSSARQLWDCPGHVRVWKQPWIPICKYSTQSIKTYAKICNYKICIIKCNIFIKIWI